MKLRPLILILLALLIAQLPALAQSPAPSLNDQMWEAARKGDAAAVTALLDKGADVNAKFRYGSTALFKAAERGNVEVVKGPGVVGEYPVLDAGQSYEYTSFCPLPTSLGTMHGAYTMRTRSGETFEATIGAFTLAVPGVVN